MTSARERRVRIAYFGTPQDAVPPLRALLDAGHEVVLVVTQPDRRRGRRGSDEPSPVKAVAAASGLAVRTPERTTEVLEELGALAPDVGVVVAFGQLLPAAVLRTARYGFVNLHFSLLPRWRGAAPVERAILAGDEETGVSVMRLDEGMDTGPVFATVPTAIGPDETAGELRARLVALGTPVLATTVAAIADLQPVPQGELGREPTLAPKVTVDDFRLEWARPAADLARVVRAGNPRPGAWTHLEGARFKVLRAVADGSAEPTTSPGTVTADATVVTGRGVLRLVEVQPAGRRAMSATAWLAGRRGRPTRFEA